MEREGHEPGAIGDVERLMNQTTEAAFHIGTLFPPDHWEPGEYIEVRCLDTSRRPARPGPRAFFSDHGSLLRFALHACQQWDVFVGVGWRRCPEHDDINLCVCPTKGADHVSRLNAAYADLDIGKAGDSIDEILSRVDAGELRPAIVVVTGHGAHAYWTLEEPTSDLELVRRINRGVRDRFGGDNAIDPARILRLAGTLNHKQSPPMPVRLLRAVGEAVSA